MLQWAHRAWTRLTKSTIHRRPSYLFRSEDMSGQFNLGKVALADGLQQSVISYMGVFIRRRHHIANTRDTGTPSSFGIRVSLTERWDIGIKTMFQMVKLRWHSNSTTFSPLTFTHSHMLISVSDWFTRGKYGNSHTAAEQNTAQYCSIFLES